MKNLVVLALVIVSSVAMAKTHKATAEQKKAAETACEASKADKKAHKECMKAELAKATETAAAPATTEAPATTAPATK